MLSKLRLTEKLIIINFINKKSEFIDKGRHLIKHLLRNVKEKYHSCNFIV